MSTSKTIWFLATSKSGLGHLRRISNIASHVIVGNGHPAVGLLTNAKLSGLSDADRALYDQVKLAERPEMAAQLESENVAAIVVDTAVVPGIHQREEPLILILREMPDERVQRFRLPDGRPWDLVIVPNPENHWLPVAGPDFARNVAAVGWIYRLPTAVHRPPSAQPKVLIATGGGGKEEGAAILRGQIDYLIAALRAKTSNPFLVQQALAARAPSQARLSEADTVFDPGGALNDCFAAVDIVVSTAGYNSVLELAMTDTPTMLVPIPRSIDDQAGRARLWGPRVGCHLDPEAPEVGLNWLKQLVEAPVRRKPVDLGSSGGSEAAQRILALV